LLFAAAMIGSYVLSFQIYLALPLQASLLTKRYESLLVAAIFVISGLVSVAGQLRITRWFAARWGPGLSLAIGLTILAASFLPLTVIPDSQRFGTVAAIAALLVSAAMLAVGGAAVFPFEMDIVVALAKGRLVATHYGFYSTIVGVGILAGNLATGAIMSAARQLGHGELTWAMLIVIGIIAALALHRLDRSGHLQAHNTTENPRVHPVGPAAINPEPTRAGPTSPRKGGFVVDEIDQPMVLGVALGGRSREPAVDLDAVQSAAAGGCRVRGNGEEL
jgi:hypothetical protein